MLTYSAQIHTLSKPTEKPWVLLLLCAVWLCLGIIGHNPWKPDEPYVIAVVQEMIHTGNWLLPALPVNSSQPLAYLNEPPLYYWLAAGMVKLFSPWLLPAHDAARLVTPVLMSLALLLAGMTGRDLIGRRHGRSVVMILIGCIGLVEIGHQLSSAVASFVGFALAFYALALSLRAPGQAGFWLGLASVVTFLSAGLLELVLLWVVILLLPAFSAWRHKYYLVTVLLALMIALPLGLLWPYALNATHPNEFSRWWYYYAFGQLNYLAGWQWLLNLAYYLFNALWFAFPAWPLAGWTLYRQRRQLNQARLQLPLMFLMVWLLLLAISKSPNISAAMPLLLPLALLAAIELDNLRRGAAAFLNWFGMMTFGLFALLVWVGWAAMNFGWPQALAGRAYYFSPYYQPSISMVATLCAVLATLVWMWALTRKNLRGRQAVTNWAAGLTLLWGLGMTLWLPWFDAAKSYQPVMAQLEQALPATLKHPASGQAQQCLAIEGQQLLTIASVGYYNQLRLTPYRPWEEVPCDYQLIVRSDEAGLSEPGWITLWSGSRPREQNMTFILLQRSLPSPSQTNAAE